MDFFDKNMDKINKPDYKSFEDNFGESGMGVETRWDGLTDKAMKWHDNICSLNQMSYKQKAIIDLALVCIEDVMLKANVEIMKLDTQ